jgi:hypothetical protein
VKSQTLYRGEPKKARLTKMDKAWNYVEKMKKRAELKKKEAAA